jgi:hypothetical protein
MAYRCPIDQANFQKYLKQTNELKNGLKTVLPLFNEKIGWADIERTLQKIQIHFQHVETPYIFQKAILFRRLAQCLNPNIEEGVHKTVLEIYDKILSNLFKNGETVMNDLFYITMGLFPYLQVCSNEKKKHIYRIINSYILPFGAHLGPLVPALINALSPGLIENNPEIDSEVFKIFDSLITSLPGPYFYGSLWLVLFRSPKSRYGVLKFLNYHLAKKNKEMEELKMQSQSQPRLEISNAEIEAANYGNTNPDNSSHFDRLSSDFLSAQKAQTFSANKNHPKALKAHTKEPHDQHQQLDFDKKDESLAQTEKIEVPINSENENKDREKNEQNHFTGDDNLPLSHIDKVEENFANHFDENSGDDFNIVEQTHESGAPQVHVETPAGEDAELATDLNADYQMENQENFGNYDTFILYCKSMWVSWNNDMVSCTSDIFPNKQMVLTALKSALQDDSVLIQRQTLEFIITFASAENNVFNEEETIHLYRSCILMLTNNEYSIKRRVLKLLFVYDEEDQQDLLPDPRALEMTIRTLHLVFENCKKKKDPVIFKVLQNMFMDREAVIEPIITSLNSDILETLTSYSIDQRRSVGYSFFISIYSYFYIFVDSYTSKEGDKITVEALKVLTELGKDHLEFEENEERVNGVPQSIYNYHIEKVRQAILSNPQKYPEGHSDMECIPYDISSEPALFDNEEDDLPLRDNFIAHLLRINILRGYLKLVAFSPLSSEAALKEILTLNENWPDLHFTSELNTLARTFLENFKKNLLNSSIQDFNISAFEQALRTGVLFLQKLNDNGLTNEWASEIEVFLQSLENSPHFCLVAIRGITEFISQEQSEVFRRLNEAAIITVWRLLDDIRFHSAAYSLINELGRYQSDLMLQILEEKLSDDEIFVRVNHLQRVIIYWKIGNSQTHQERQGKLEDSLTFTLLDHLENPHPVLRQIAKSWLIDSASFLDRILDPLLRQLVHSCHLFPTFSGRIFHTNIFDVTKVMETFRRLKFMVTNNPAKFANFVLSVKLSEGLSAVFSIQQNPPVKADTYSDLLILYAIHFLRAGVLPFMGRRFRQDNLLVATASCELLELIIKTLLTSNPGFLDEDLVEMLLKCYYQFVRDESSVMQINMINLMKVILFQSGFLERNNKNLSLFEKIFREKKLLENVIGSIGNNKSSHTLLKIVDFLQTTIEVFSENMFPENKLKDIVSLVFESYYKYISEEIGEVSGQTSFESMVVLVDAAFKLFDKYFNLSEFKIPNASDRKGSIFVSILTLGMYRGGEKIPQSSYRLIEAYLLENFDKLMLIMVKGWKMIRNAESTYQFYNIGPMAYSDETFEGKKNDPPVITQKSATKEKNKLSFQTRNSVIINKILMDQGDNLDPEQSKDEIYEICEKLFYKYKTSFIDGLLKIWIQSYDNILPENALNQNKTRVKLMDIIMYLNLEVADINRLILESNVYREIKLEKKKSKEQRINWKISQTECSMMGLYYGYLKYKKKLFIEDKVQRKVFIRSVWTALFEFLQSFVESSHPQVDLWVINIYHLCSLKYPVQEIISEYTIKKTLHIHENTVFEKIVGFICDEAKFKFPFDRNPLTNAFTFSFPLPALAVNLGFSEPSIYIPKLTGKFDEDFHLRYYTKIIALKFLKSITIKLLKLTYASKTNDRIARRVYNIVSKLFIYIESLLKNKIAINENLYIEIIEYLFIFLDDSREFLMQALDPLIERFFDSELFFECPSKSLVLWSKIINWHVALSTERILTKYLIK